MGGICFYKKIRINLYDVHGKYQECTDKRKYEGKVFEAHHYGENEEGGGYEKQQPVKHS
jgi:hypothetical protein